MTFLSNAFCPVPPDGNTFLMVENGDLGMRICSESSSLYLSFAALKMC